MDLKRDSEWWSPTSIDGFTFKEFFSVKVASILPATPLPFKRAMTLVPVFPLNYPTNGGGEWHLITLLQI